MPDYQPTVFVVDDDAQVRKSLLRSLSIRGLTVESFDSASTFLRDSHPGKHGCLVLDLSMPGMSGLDLQRRLQQHGWQLPIIFITGHGDIARSEQALKSGAIDFLEKPFNLETLLSRIEEAFALDQKLRGYSPDLNTV